MTTQIQIPSISDIMETKIIRLDPDTPIEEAIETLLKNKRSGACVVEGEGRLAGMLSEKDCLRLFAVGAFNQLPGGTVRQYMSQELTTVRPDDGLFTAVDIFLKNPFRRLPVVDDEKLVGQVTRSLVLQGTRYIWKESPTEKPWTDSKYLTDEIKAALQ